MKRFQNILIVALLAVFAIACKDGYIDEISNVEPGADESAPQVVIHYPQEGELVQDSLEVSPITFQLTASDDIEIKEVIVELDGMEIGNFTSFTDYRIVKKDLLYESLEVGSHTLKVTATDIEGKTTVETVNFLRVTDLGLIAPLPNESFYMPFDGEDVTRLTYRADKVNVVGSPSFVNDGWNEEAYKGAEGAMLTIPFDGLASGEFTAAFWYKVDPTPDRAGILTVGATTENRNQGFRLFREGNETEQRIKLNVGTGDGESWNDGEVLDPTADEWVHVAFTISATQNTIYFNGVEQRTSEMASQIDWTGVKELTIAAGGETFSYWDHLSDYSLYDELRLFDKALSPSELEGLMNAVPDVSESEIFYLSFDGNYMVEQVATTVGSPSLTEESVYREAYNGATDSYITLPATGFTTNEFSAAFWYNVNPTPDRAGILTVGATTENRNQGFRLFREGNDTEQRIKLNVGTGDGESWNDGDVLDPAAGEWVHIAITISESANTIYFNGEEKRTSEMAAPIDWSGVKDLTIAAGGETFSYWDHLSDLSLYDELRFFSKALSQAEIQAIYNDEK